MYHNYYFTSNKYTKGANKPYMSDLVSIIIPVYKVEKYLAQCIESVLSQDYSNIEVILVDDGSPDKCGLICDEFAKKDSRITVIHKQNEGLSSARNSGIDIAKGKYISFIDSDDYISEKYISTMINEFSDNNTDLVICSYYYVYSHEHNTDSLRLSRQNNHTKEMFSGMDLITNRFTNLRVHYTVSTNKLYKTELFNHTRFEKGVLHEDEFIYRSIMEQCKQVVVIDEPLYYYRQRTDSIMSNYSVKNFEYNLIWMSREIDYYKSQKMYETLLTLEHLLCHEYTLYKKDLDKNAKRKHYHTLVTAMKDISSSKHFSPITRLHYFCERLWFVLRLYV